MCDEDTGIEPYLEERIRLLRAEASGLKDCFTRYAFQCTALSVGALGVISHYIWATPATALASVAVIVLTLATTRIGTFKYGAANRILGYELHLYRTFQVPEEFRGEWKPEYRRIGWEEALRAWRIVQATVFEKVYEYGSMRPNFLKQDYQQKAPHWFQQASLIRDSRGAAYHAGTYLKTIMIVLHGLAFVSAASLFVMTYMLSAAHDSTVGRTVWALALSLAAAGYLGLRMLQDHARRLILEDGILSIHASSIMWQAIVIAHYKAVEQARDRMNALHDRQPDGAGLRGYTSRLGKLAVSMSEHADDIHSWIGGAWLTCAHESCALARAPRPRTADGSSPISWS